MAQSFPSLDVAGQTDVGLKRSKNEDSFTVVMPPAGAPQVGRGALFVVADGMGGMGGGDVASKTAIDEIVKQFYDSTAISDYDPLPRLRMALEAANVRVRETAQTVGLPRIGATGAGMVLTSTGDAVVFNVGDSRVYRARGNYIELLTRDQSVMASQLEAGLVTQEEAKLSRNVNVTSFIGQPMTLSPVYSRMQTQPGDVFVICSDGLWDLVEPNEILKVVQAPAKNAARKLIAMVRQRGAPDNVTVIIVRIGTAPSSLPLPLIGGIAAALVVIVAAVALLRSGTFGETHTATPTETPTEQATSTASAADTEAAAPSPEVISMSLITATPEVTALAVVTTSTPEQTAAVVAAQPTDTATVAPTATATSTASATRTLSPAPKSTDTPASTATPSSTSTRAPSRTPTPSQTPTLEPTRTPSSTSAPTATTPHEPTVTVNPTLITFTPGPGPLKSATALPVSAANRDEFMLAVARTDGVILRSSATLYLYGAATPEATIESSPEATAAASAEATLDPLSAILTDVSFITTVAAATNEPMIRATSEVTATAEVTTEPVSTADATAEVTVTAEVSGAQVPLDVGVHLRLIDAPIALADVSIVDRLVLVTVTSGDHSGENGWIHLSSLLQSLPGAPYIVTSASVARGVNVRGGEGLLSPVVAQLLPGQYARLAGVSNSPLGWYFVELPTGGRGWVSPENVLVEGDRSGVKRMTPPPTPTFTPSPTDTPPPPPSLTPFGAG